MVNTQRFILDIKRPTIPRLRLVNGDTANVFVITVQDDGNAVTLDATLHKVIAVFTRADGEVYTQDADTGLSFTTGGVVTINVRPASFRTGTNKVCLQIYKRESADATEYPLLCTTTEAQFSARAQAIPDSGAENAPSQLPMLEQLISDAQDAIDDCEDATEAANDAADAANDAAEAANAATAACPAVLHVTNVNWNSSNELTVIEFSETAEQIYTAIGNNRGIEFSVNTSHEENGITVFEQRYVRQQMYAVVGESAPFMLESYLYCEYDDGSYCSIILGVTGGSDEIAFEGEFGRKPPLSIDATPTNGSANPVSSGGVYTALAGKQNTLTFDDAPTSGSNNPVKSGGIKTAIDTASHKNVYLVKHDAEFPNAHSVQAQGYTDDFGDDLDAISESAVFAAQIALPDGTVATLYEYNRDDTYDYYYLKSEVVGGVYVTALLDNTTSHNVSQITFDLHEDESPLVVHPTIDPDTNRVTFRTGEAEAILAATSRDITMYIPLGTETITVYCLEKTRTTTVLDGEYTRTTVKFIARDEDAITVTAYYYNNLLLYAQFVYDR